MATEPSRSRARRAWLLLAALLLGVGLTTMLATPGVPATCTKILELATLAGESVGGDDRKACEAHYRRLREHRGALGWIRLSWCTRLARSIPEAGQC